MIDAPTDSHTLTNLRTSNRRLGRAIGIVVAVVLAVDLILFDIKPSPLVAISIVVASFSLVYSRATSRRIDRYYAGAIRMTDALPGLLRFNATMTEALLAGWPHDDLRSLAKVYPPPELPTWLKLHLVAR